MESNNLLKNILASLPKIRSMVLIMEPTAKYPPQEVIKAESLLKLLEKYTGILSRFFEDDLAAIEQTLITATAVDIYFYAGEKRGEEKVTTRKGIMKTITKSAIGYFLARLVIKTGSNEEIKVFQEVPGKV